MKITQILHFNLIFFISYIVLFIIQQHLIFPIQQSFISFGVLSGSLLFLPHGLRVIAVLVGGYWIFPGLYFAHILTGLYFLEIVNWDENLIRSLLSMLAVYFPLIFLKKNDIDLQNILVLSLTASFLNSLFQTLYLQWSELNLNGLVILSYLVGDILGSLFLFYFIKYIKIQSQIKVT